MSRRARGKPGRVSDSMSRLNGKTILVTGGTGSFGVAFVETLLREHDPGVVRVYSRDEFKQLQMRERIGDEKVRYLIGDVRDRERLMRAFDGVDVVVHAAALKQVPTAEYNPIEAVRTNIDGTVNVINAAIDRGVSQLMFLSTDKAVEPINLYGATKLVAEKLCVNANVYNTPRGTFISCTRYGNVLGSRGSVVTTFLQQRANGVLTITDQNMTRFWITVEQGVNFVIDSIERMVGGEVFIPKIPSMRLKELSEAVAPDARHEIIGARPGEKSHEALISREESARAVIYDDYFMIDTFGSASTNPLPGGVRPTETFEYRSDTNDRWLTVDDLRAMLTEAGLLP